MEVAGINLVGVLVAAIAGFAFGAIYYTLLSKPWLDASGKTEEDVKGRNSGPFLTSFVSLLVMGAVLAGLFQHHPAGDVSWLQAIESAAILWVGLIVTCMATNNAFQGARAKLTVIDSGHWLGVLAVQSLIVSRF